MKYFLKETRPGPAEPFTKLGCDKLFEQFNARAKLEAEAISGYFNLHGRVALDYHFQFPGAQKTNTADG